jgi:gliding motility-associated-like protein
MSRNNFIKWNVHRGLLVLLFVWLAVGFSQARHIVGGDVVYNCMGIDTISQTISYEVIFTMYRDAAGGGADFDPDASFGVYKGGRNSWTYVRTVSNRPATDIELVNNIDANPCLIIPPNIRVEKGVYRFNLTLPISNDTYLISYQRCCRNVTINNIVRPDETGAAFTVEITPFAQETCNNSPKFNKFPPIVICLGERVNFDHSATDPEGDQLVYEFCAPLTSGGQDGAMGGGDPNSCTGVRPDPQRCPPLYDEVTFRLPTYSAVNPIGGDPQIRIDSETGRITGIPTQLGQFVVGVCVKEFRNGQLMGELRRDFQFNVAVCEQSVVAQVQSDATQGDRDFLINSCGNNTVTFVNESYEEASIQSYYWNFDINGTSKIVNTRDATITFPGIGEYNGQMIINRGTECADTANIFVNVFPSIEAEYTFDYDTCIAGPVSFFDGSSSGAGPIKRWDWQFGDGGLSGRQDPAYRYEEPGVRLVTLTVEDNNQCTDVVTKRVTWQPAPSTIIVEPTTFIGCKPANIFFNNLSSPIDSTYDINWDFGDGKTSKDISPTHIFEEEGIFDIKIDITTPIGCSVSKTFRDWIKVEPSPTADFVFSPEEPSNFNKELSFTDRSEGATGWFWNFSDLGISFDVNPTFQFPDTGVYKVDLIVLNERSCPDTMTQFIDIKPVVTLNMPTAFTPNNDAMNDIFYGKGYYDGIRGYNFSIFNRWGEQVFSTADPLEGWNGRFNNSGEDSPSGVYVYVIEYIGPRGKTQTLKGHVTLVR